MGYNEELQHHGILGMKWGVRRYQRKDGSLTPAGKKRYNAEMDKLKAEEKVIKNKQRTQAKLDKLEAKRRDVEAQKAALNPKTKKSKSGEKVEPSEEPKKKSIKDMSDEELAAAIRRSQMEQQYRQLNPPKVSAGEKFVKEAVMPAVTQAGKQLIQDTITKQGKKFLGIKDDDMSALKKEVEKLNLTKQFKELSDSGYNNLKKEVNKLTLEKQLEKLKSEKETAKEDRSDSSNEKTEAKTQSNKESDKSESSSGTTGRRGEKWGKRESTKDSDDGPLTGEVIGEGTSKAKANSGKKWWEENAVDMEYEVVNDISSSTASNGRNYINELPSSSGLLALPVSSLARYDDDD